MVRKISSKGGHIPFKCCGFFSSLCPYFRSIFPRFISFFLSIRKSGMKTSFSIYQCRECDFCKTEFQYGIWRFEIPIATYWTSATIIGIFDLHYIKVYKLLILIYRLEFYPEPKRHDWSKSYWSSVYIGDNGIVSIMPSHNALVRYSTLKFFVIS